MQPQYTATIWISPYRISYTTGDYEFTGAINKPDPDLLQKTLERLCQFLAIEGYLTLILHTEH